MQNIKKGGGLEQIGATQTKSRDTRAVSERRGEIRVQHNGNGEEYNPGERSGTESSAVASDESAGTPHLVPVWRCTGDYSVQNPARVSTSKKQGGSKARLLTFANILGSLSCLQSVRPGSLTAVLAPKGWGPPIWLPPRRLRQRSPMPEIVFTHLMRHIWKVSAINSD